MSDFDPTYPETVCDRFLAQIRASFPSAEFRHESLAWLARAAQLFAPWEAPNEAAVQVGFADGSRPLELRSPLVLAAGAVKYGWHLPAFAALGFGAVTVGTATLRPRSGNPLRPRVRTLEDEGAIQNAMGLNNPGVETLVRRIDRARLACDGSELAVGLSVSEDPDLLPGEDPDGNVLACLAAAWDSIDYAELNLSCPNTGHERLDRAWDRIRRLLGRVANFRERTGARKPLWVKLSPDLSPEALGEALATVAEAGLTGVVLFNTWPASSGTWPTGEDLPDLPEVGRRGLRGGLSGRPLFPRTLSGVREAQALRPELSIVASGGVEIGSQVAHLREAGADLVQVYSVLAFRWMAARRIVEELAGQD